MTVGPAAWELHSVKDGASGVLRVLALPACALCLRGFRAPMCLEIAELSKPLEAALVSLWPLSVLAQSLLEAPILIFSGSYSFCHFSIVSFLRLISSRRIEGITMKWAGHWNHICCHVSICSANIKLQIGPRAQGLIGIQNLLPHQPDRVV